MIALPQFASGAMENWGLITYRERRMVYGNESSPVVHRDIGTTVCHEIAHMVKVILLPTFAIEISGSATL